MISDSSTEAPSPATLTARKETASSWRFAVASVVMSTSIAGLLVGDLVHSKSAFFCAAVPIWIAATLFSLWPQLRRNALPKLGWGRLALVSVGLLVVALPLIPFLAGGLLAIFDIMSGNVMD